MPAPRGPQLTENDLRKVLNARRLREAEALLSAGFLVERVLYRNGAVAARWSMDRYSEHTIMVVQYGAVDVGCTCEVFEDGENCQHVDALAVAWVRSPDTFTAVDISRTIDEFFLEHESDEDLDDLLGEDDDDAALAQQMEPAAAFLAPPAQRLSPTLRTALPDLTDEYRHVFASATVAQMRHIARQRGVTVSGSRDAIAETLAVALGNPAAIGQAVAGLSPTAHLILALLPFALRGSQADNYALQTMFTALGISMDEKSRQALTELNDLGLVLQTSQGYFAWPRGLSLYGGAEPRLARLLPKHTQLRLVSTGPLDFISFITRLLFVLHARPWPVRPAPAPPPIALAPMTVSWPFVPEEVAALARQASSSRAMRASALTVPPREPLLADDALAEITRQLETEPARVDFAMRLLADLGVIRPTLTNEIALEEGAFLLLISQHPVQSVLPFFQTSLLLSHWVELDLAAQRTPGLRLRRDVQLAYSLPASHLVGLTHGMRSSALNILERLPAGEWIDLAAFVAQAHALNAFGALWRLPQGLSLELDGRALLTQPLSDWAKSFQPWFEALLTGPLYWQGVVDLGYDRDKLVGFRLTELGALLTLKTFTFTAPDSAPASGHPLAFEADGSLRLQAASAEPALLGLLAGLGELRPGPAGSLLSAPTAQGALRVFQGGWDAQRLITTLEQAAGQPVPAALAGQWREWWRRLGELQIYQGLALLELGDDFAFDELMANTSLSRSLLYRFSPRLAAIRPEAIETLRSELVAKGYTPKVSAPPAAFPGSLSMPDELSTLLDAYNSGSLTAIAGYHGLVNKGAQTKAQSIASLSRALAEPARIARTWQDLSPAERALVEELQRRSGQALPRVLHRSLAGAGLVDAPSPTPDRREANPRAVNSRRFVDVLARLNLRGLVFECEDVPPPHGYSPSATPPKRDFRRIGGQVCLPAAILAHLPPPPSVAPVETLEVEHIRPASARTFQRDLYLYWSFVRETPFRLTLKGQPPKPVLKTLAAQLLERAETDRSPDETSQPRLRFVRQLLQLLGLLAASAERDLRVTSRADFFSLPPLERVQRTFEVWRSGGWFFEFGLLPAGVRPSDTELDSAPQSNSALTQARTTVLRQLAGQFGEGWQSLPALIDEIRDQDYQFLIPRPPAHQQMYYRGPYDPTLNPYGLAFGSLYGNADSHWDQVEANFIRAVITGPLHWLGLVDTALLLGVDGPPSAFRLTEMGRWVLGLGSPPALQAEGGRVIAQPNLHIVALDPVADATLVQLDQFAERLSAERAVEYRLTRGSVYAGQQAGWDVPRIKAFLRAQTRADLPGNLERTLDEWQTQHERIILRAGVSLAHGPADLFDAILADPRSQPLVAGRPTPEVVILSAPVVGFVEAAARLGVLPLLNQPEEPSGDSVEADETGRVRLLAARPNLYLHGRLAAFADPAGDGLYQISAESVSRAVRAGLAAPAIVQQLQRLHRGPLPAGLPQRIKAWAHHYGDGALEEVVLLQLNDPAILAELMAEPDLADLLKPFKPAPAKPLARVRRKDLETLRAGLAARGINLKDKLA